MPLWITFVRFAAGAMCIIGMIFAVVVAGRRVVRGDVWTVVAGSVIAIAVYGFWRLANWFAAKAAALQREA